jgi:hypothetical protein
MFKGKKKQKRGKEKKRIRKDKKKGSNNVKKYKVRGSRVKTKFFLSFVSL